MLLVFILRNLLLLLLTQFGIVYQSEDGLVKQQNGTILN